MAHNSYRPATRMLVCGLVAFAVPTAFAQGPRPKVDFEEETHFRCYIVSQQTPQPATSVTLDDQFLQDVPLEIDEPLQFCAPVSKNGLPIEEPEEHLTMYAAAANLETHLTVDTQDQFGLRTLEAVGARVLFVPTQKLAVSGVDTGLGFPDKLNHWWCYEVNGEPVDQDVTLDDQFRSDAVRVEQPVYFCNPVEKTRVGARRAERPPEPDVHLTCYDIHGPQSTNPTRVDIVNQFEQDTFTITSFELLCVPSAKLGFRPAS
jgi:hypothetical protein